MVLINKIYTKKGDRGVTILKGRKIKKSDKIFDFFGNLDELNCFVGFLKCNLRRKKKVFIQLNTIQNKLFDIGANVAGSKKKNITKDEILALEQSIDLIKKNIKPIKSFLIPGKNKNDAIIHICRSITRRTERSYLKIKFKNEEIKKYLNRLSDFFFALSRSKQISNKKDELWK